MMTIPKEKSPSNALLSSKLDAMGKDMKKLKKMLKGDAEVPRQWAPEVKLFK